MTFLSEWLHKLYAMWIIPRWEKQLEYINREITYTQIQAGTGSTEEVKAAYKLNSLTTAKEYITHKIDYTSGWL